MKGTFLFAVIITMVAVGGLFGLHVSGEQPGFVVQFAIKPEWNISGGIIRISGGDYFWDFPAEQFVDKNYVKVDLNLLNLSGLFLANTADAVYVDLLMGGVLMESRSLESGSAGNSRTEQTGGSLQNPQNPIQENPVQELGEDTAYTIAQSVQLTTDPIIQSPDPIIQSRSYQTAVFSAAAYAGWYNPSANESGTMQIDYAEISPVFVDTDTQIACENGSITSDVSLLYYRWYVNDAVSQDWTNATTAKNFSSANFNAGQEVYCQIMPNNGTANGTAVDSRNRVTVLTTDDHFNNGTFTNTKVAGTGIAANITLSNSSGSAYNPDGNWTSALIDLRNSSNALTLSYGYSLAETGTSNVSLQARTGKPANNRTSTEWGEWSGPDYITSTNGLNGLMLGFAFSEGKENITINVGGRNGTLSFASWTSRGKYGNALRFNGIDSSVSVPNYGQIADVGSNFSLEAWIKGTFTGNHTIFDKAGIYNLGVENGKAVARINTSSLTTITGTTPLNNETWYHLAATYDNATFRLYVNGVEDANTTANGSISVNTGRAFIGRAVTDAFFNGTIDSVAVWNRSLTTNEITNRTYDRFTNSSGEGVYSLSRYVQFRAFLASGNSSFTPSLKYIALKQTNYSFIILNSAPTPANLTGPANNTQLTATNGEFNWSLSSDPDSDSIFYEIIIDNNTHFLTPEYSALALNNFSEQLADNNTILNEHFEGIEGMMENRATIIRKINPAIGMFGNSIEISTDASKLKYLKAMPRSEGTIELWVKRQWGTGETNFFLDEIYNVVRVYKDTNSILRFNVSNVSISYDISGWELNSWNHLAATWKENSNISLYINGALANTTNITSIPSTSGSTHIGTDSTYLNIANATIDELRISNITRTQVATSQNANINLSSFGDGTYYWKVRALNQNPLAQSNETAFGNWSNTSLFRLERHTPSIEISRFVAQNISTAIINISASEVVYCEYKNSTISFTPFQSTNSLISTTNLNLSYGDYTFTANCNDSANKFINDTISFSIVKRDLPPLDTVSKKVNLTNNVPLEINLSTYLNLTIIPSANVSGWLSLARYNSNPENSLTGLPAHKLSFYVVVVDEQIKDNSSYVQVKIPYTHNELIDADIYEATMGIYQYNLASDSWAAPETKAIHTANNVGYANVTTFRTFVLAGKPAPAAAAAGAGGGDLQGASPRPQIKPQQPIQPVPKFNPALTQNRFVQSFERMPPGSQVINIRNVQIGVIDISFDLSREYTNADFRIDKNEKPQHLIRNAYNYFSIQSPFEDAQNIRIRVGVDKKWLKGNNFDKEKMKVVKFRNGRWIRPRFVNITSEDEEYVYYEVETDSLAGEFAIAAVLEAEGQEIEEYIPPEPEARYVEVAATAAGSLILATALSFFLFRGFMNAYTKTKRKRGQFHIKRTKPSFLEDKEKENPRAK